MKRHACVLACAGLAAALASVGQARDFSPKPPSWQVALAESKGASAGDAIASSGKGAATACAGCHGANGIPAPGIPFPRLAGLPVEYVAKQLFDYRGGSRPNAIMGPIAKALTDADIASLALHYASLPAPALKQAPGDVVGTRGWHLARYGDNTLAIPACADCHGSDATGAGPVLPPLAQSAAYTSAQLKAFRAGERKNDGDTVMRELSKRLSDADVEALASYYAGR